MHSIAISAWDWMALILLRKLVLPELLVALIKSSTIKQIYLKFKSFHWWNLLTLDVFFSLLVLLFWWHIFLPPPRCRVCSSSCSWWTSWDGRPPSRESTLAKLSRTSRCWIQMMILTKISCDFEMLFCCRSMWARTSRRTICWWASHRRSRIHSGRSLHVTSSKCCKTNKDKTYVKH